jgi:hypothetical protein
VAGSPITVDTGVRAYGLTGAGTDAESEGVAGWDDGALAVVGADIDGEPAPDPVAWPVDEVHPTNIRTARMGPNRRNSTHPA